MTVALMCCRRASSAAMQGRASEKLAAASRRHALSRGSVAVRLLPAATSLHACISKQHELANTSRKCCSPFQRRPPASHCQHSSNTMTLMHIKSHASP